MAEQKIKAIYGTKDILPPESNLWLRVISTIARIASEYNYHFINPPIFEATELFARGIGETTDVVSKEMYTFNDQGNRSLTLRPEGTAGVVRAYIEHSMWAAQGLTKFWYLGPMFRQERPQAGRFRQFHQFGIEAIGSLDPAIDAEIIDLNYRILQRLGIENLEVHINSVGMPEDRKRHKDAFVKFVEPELPAFCADCQRRFQLNPLRMFDCKEKSCQKILADAPVIFDFLSNENHEHFDQVVEYLGMAEVPFHKDKRMVRGLDYYSRTAWEIKSSKLGAQDSLSGGGRYDLLVEQLGGPPTPAIGFAAGIERIVLAMSSEDEQTTENLFGFYVVLSSSEYKSEAFRLATKIRSLGIPADIDYLRRSMKAQMKQADKSGLSHAIILAENELARGEVIIKDLRNSEQMEIKLDYIYGFTNSDQLGEIIGHIR